MKRKTITDLRLEDELTRRQNLGVTRYVITHMGRDGIRTIFGAAQGHNTFATAEEAARHLEAIVTNNSSERLSEICEMPLEVRPCICWPGHFDPKSIYFD